MRRIFKLTMILASLVVLSGCNNCIDACSQAITCKQIRTQRFKACLNACARLEHTDPDRFQSAIDKLMTTSCEK